MSLLTRDALRGRLNSGADDQIFLDPLLSEDQIGSVSIDLRLGYDFLVSVVGSRPSVIVRSNTESAGPENFFDFIRRDIGDRFLVHPGQTVLATSLEYMGLPKDIYADIVSRSSYHRLGLSVSSMFQPGFRGCVSLELFNHSNVPVELIVGCRLIQARFYSVTDAQGYLDGAHRRKYIGHVRPTASKASEDKDLELLEKVKA